MVAASSVTTGTRLWRTDGVNDRAARFRPPIRTAVEQIWQSRPRSAGLGGAQAAARGAGGLAGEQRRRAALRLPGHAGLRARSVAAAAAVRPVRAHAAPARRAALLGAGRPATPDGANPQTAPRVTVTGLAETGDDPALKARYAGGASLCAMYAEFGDFRLWRIGPLGALYVGGFARAARLRARRSRARSRRGRRDRGGRGRHRRTLQRRPSGRDWPPSPGPAAGDWRMVAVDVDGCDLALGERVIRVDWSAPVADPDDVRRELIRLARAARAS